MKLFIDTANLDEIKEVARWGIVDGVTTNPSLAAKENISFDELLRVILDIIDGPISAEVISTDVKGIVSEGRRLAKIHPNVVVKIPMIQDGVAATKTLTEEGIKVNVTLCFSALQAMLAAKVNATYISPFVGRLDDIGQEGMALIAEIRQIYDNYGFETQILTASVRHPQHALQAAKMGSDVATMPYKVLKQLYHHPLTDSGLEKFLADWNQSSNAEVKVS